MTHYVCSDNKFPDQKRILLCTGKPCGDLESAMSPTCPECQKRLELLRAARCTSQSPTQ